MQPIASPVQPIPQAQMTALPPGGGQPPAQPMPAPVQGMQEAGRGGPDEAMQAMQAQMTDDQRTRFQQRIDAMGPVEKMAFIKNFATEFGAAAGDAGDDMTRADALRQGAPTSGGAVGPSGVYVGSSPLEHIAQVMNNKQRDAEYETAKGVRTDARAGQNDRNTEMLGMTMPGVLRQNL
jgi:hypothetical protein